MVKCTGVQLSGFNNITTQNVDGIQATGFVNVAFKDVNMAQLSGFVNYGRNIGGLQATGFVNIATGNVEAAQLAGYVNISRDVNGVQAAGFVNIAHGNIGMAQLAGFVNYCDSVTGAQLAGFVNVARLNVTAVQGAGFVNYGTSVTGAQLAGFLNVCATENTGVQIAGFLNVAKTLNGLQIAAVNIADSVIKGVPIGFFSFVRKGYHVLEFSTDEVFRTNYIFKTGVRKFYNILGYARTSNDLSGFIYGFGFDTTIKSKHAINFDFTFTSIADMSKQVNSFGTVFKFSPCYNYSFYKHLTVFAGPSLSIYAGNLNNSDGEITGVAFHPFWDKLYDKARTQMWAGASVGLRF